MAVHDHEPEPYSFDSETETKENTNYRTTAGTGKYLPITLMSITVGESISLEVHPDNDQFLCLDVGKGKVAMRDAEDNLSFEQEVGDGWAVMVPAGKWHDIVGLSNIWGINPTSSSSGTRLTMLRPGQSARVDL